MGKHASSIDSAVLQRFQMEGPGKVLCPSDFLNLGSRAAIDQALSRNIRSGFIRKIARGLYDLPQRHRMWGDIPSTPDAVVEALMRRDRIEVKPGDSAVFAPEAPKRNASERIYLTDGHSRRLVIGNKTIRLKHVSARTLAIAGTVVGDIVGALRRTGRGKIDASELGSLVKGLSADKRARLLEDMRLAPSWLADAIRKILSTDFR